MIADGARPACLRERETDALHILSSVRETPPQYVTTFADILFERSPKGVVSSRTSRLLTTRCVFIVA